MAKTTAIEIDGAHVRAITMNGTTITDFVIFDGTTTDDALSQYTKAKGKPGADDIVLWAGRSELRLTELDECPDHVLPVAVRDAAERVLPGGMAVAGVVSGEAHAGKRPGVLAGIELPDLDPVYKTFGKTIKVYPAAFAYNEDGAYLAIRASTVEMTQVENGMVNAARTLNVEGVDQIAPRIQGLTQAEAARELDDYAERLVNQTNETLRQWGRDSRTTGTSNLLFVLGLGSDVPGLRDRLRQRTGRQVTVPAATGVTLETVAGRENIAYQTVYGITSGLADLPAARLVNPVIEQAKVEKRNKDKRQRRTVFAIAGAAAAVLALGYPFVNARGNLAEAESNYDTAAANFAAVEQFDRLGFTLGEYERTVKGIEASDPFWAETVRFFTEELPKSAPLRIEGMSLQPGDGGMRINVQLTTQDPLVVENTRLWLANLTRELQIDSAWAPTISHDPETGNVRLELNLQVLDKDGRFYFFGVVPDEAQSRPDTSDVSGAAVASTEVLADDND
jgi:hypothetical protein